MRNPDPPFLELGFYFRDLSGREAIRLLAMSFVSSFDAFPKDAVTIDSSSRSLFRANESSDRVEQLGNTEQMGRLLSDPSKFVKKITIEDGSGIVPDAREYLAVLPIASPECESEGNSVSVWVEGEAFCRASTHNGLENEQRTAAKALEVFKKLVKQLSPSYAAITLDYGLETPCDLRLDSRTHAFRDFYLRRNDFGESFLSDVCRMCPHGVHEHLDEGQVTIMTRSFRVALGHDVAGDHNDYELSEFVGKSIAKMLTYGG